MSVHINTNARSCSFFLCFPQESKSPEGQADEVDPVEGEDEVGRAVVAAEASGVAHREGGVFRVVGVVHQGDAVSVVEVASAEVDLAEVALAEAGAVVVVVVVGHDVCMCKSNVVRVRSLSSLPCYSPFWWTHNASIIDRWL